MSAVKCNPPVGAESLPHPGGQPGIKESKEPYLEFPRQLKHCGVTVYSGAEELGYYSTSDYDIRLLAPNIIELIGGAYRRRVMYNVAIVITEG